MADDTNSRGFAAMDEDEQENIASEGGQSQGQENNPGNFAKDKNKASEAGQKGGQQSQNQGSSDEASDKDES